ncbi:uncharacterized protein LOC114293854 [Camellia sinensis]|uniref:uncharacterized protein LOC114293854 n=1 Tax=Camellia sinensis TaxID=4442 RepID=UPI001036432B|nr:uncharacterized protein LOC114293854 [Camellia sinensis]
MLNAEQQHAYCRIIQVVQLDKPAYFFIDGPGGCGKTFLYHALLATIRTQQKIALATATSGVAASILPNGRTPHSRFKIPIDIDGTNCCNVSKQSGLGKLLKATSLIICDESSMARREAIEAVDGLLRDIIDSNLLFGGKVMVFGSDFWPVLPVVPRATRSECINASLVKSKIWHSLQKIMLQESMRARHDPIFSSFLLRIGNGSKAQNSDGKITFLLSVILPSIQTVDPPEQLIDFVFPHLHKYSIDALSMMDCAILSPKNETIDDINKLLIKRFPGNMEEYLGIDETDDTSQQSRYENFLNFLFPAGLPPHRLLLKKNCPILLLRNIDPSEGLCNGTRLICSHFDMHVIVAEIAVGTCKGKIVFLPHIPLQPSDDKMYPVQFTRRQFPIRLCFAVTINKAQGQTLDVVDLVTNGRGLPRPILPNGARSFYGRPDKIESENGLEFRLRKKFDSTEFRDLVELTYKVSRYESLLEEEQDRSNTLYKTYYRDPNYEIDAAEIIGKEPIPEKEDPTEVYSIPEGSEGERGKFFNGSVKEPDRRKKRSKIGP